MTEQNSETTEKSPAAVTTEAEPDEYFCPCCKKNWNYSSQHGKPGFWKRKSVDGSGRHIFTPLTALGQHGR